MRGGGPGGGGGKGVPLDVGSTNLRSASRKLALIYYMVHSERIDNDRSSALLALNFFLAAHTRQWLPTRYDKCVARKRREIYLPRDFSLSR